LPDNRPFEYIKTVFDLLEDALLILAVMRSGNRVDVEDVEHQDLYDNNGDNNDDDDDQDNGDDDNDEYHNDTSDDGKVDGSDGDNEDVVDVGNDDDNGDYDNEDDVKKEEEEMVEKEKVALRMSGPYLLLWLAIVSQLGGLYFL
jgi:hypothetical protein